MRAVMVATAVLILTSGVIAEAQARAQVQPDRQGAVVVQPWEGERLAFCDTPELSAVLKIDSATAGAMRFSMGTGELAPRSSNAGRHRGNDEIIYFVRGRGEAVLGTDTVPVHTGTTLYVPQEVRHAFINPTDEVMEFVWVIAPRGFEKSLREAGVPPGTPCPPSPQR